MKIVIIKEMSTGNDTVGEMWHETKIFNSSATLMDVIMWAGTDRDIIINVPENSRDKIKTRLTTEPDN